MHKLKLLENLHIKTKEKNIIYCAYNIITHKIYVGFTTTGLSNRKKIHLFKSKQINKTNNYFFSAIKKYSKDNFKWFILDINNNIEELLEKEKYFIDYFSTNNRLYGYNMTNGGDYCKFNDEIKKKISDKIKIRFQDKTQNPWYGTTILEIWTNKYGKDIAEKKFADMQEKKSINSLGEKGSFYNKVHTIEAKSLISEARKKNVIDPEHIKKCIIAQKSCKQVLCLNNNKIYFSVRNAAKELNLDRNCIYKVLNKIKLEYKGYKFEYVNQQIPLVE